MPSLLDFPNELLFKILDELESADINVLFGMPELHELQRYAVCVITDKPQHTHHKHIPTVFSTADIPDETSTEGPSTPLPIGTKHAITAERLKKGFQVVIFELHTRILETDKLDVITPLLDVVHSHVHIYPEDCTPGARNPMPPKRLKLFMYRREFYPDDLWGKRTRTISFNVTDYFFDAPLSPAVHRFPIIKNLVLKHCEVHTDDHGAQFEMPELEELTVKKVSSVDNFFGSLNAENLPKLTSLTVRGEDSIVDCTLIPGQNLTYLCLDLPNLEKICGLSCPNLETLYLHTDSLKYIGDLTVPKLESLDIETDCGIDIHNFEADCMSHLMINAPKITRLHNIHTPELASVVLQLWEDDTDPADAEMQLDFSFLSSIKKLDVGDWEKHIGVITAPGNDLPDVIMPNLKDLTIDFPIELTLLTLPEFTSLKALRLPTAKLSSSCDLSTTLIHTPNLCSLTISVESDTTTHPTFLTASTPLPKLRKLEIKMRSANLGLKLIDCELPELETLEVLCAEVEYTAQTTLSLIAPNLTFLDMCGHSDCIVDISHSTKLDCLTIRGGLKKLTLPSTCPELTSLDLSWNPELEPLAPITLDSVTFFCADNDTPEDSLKDVLTPNVKTESDDSESYDMSDASTSTGSV